MREILIVGAGKSTSALIAYLLEKASEEQLIIKIADKDLQAAQKSCGSHVNCEAIKLYFFNS